MTSPVLADALVVGRRSDGKWRLFSVAQGYDGLSPHEAARGVALTPLTAEKGGARVLKSERLRAVAQRPARACVYMQAADLFEVGGSLWNSARRVGRNDMPESIEYDVEWRITLSMADAAEALVAVARQRAREAAAVVAEAVVPMGLPVSCRWRNGPWSAERANRARRQGRAAACSRPSSGG